MSNIKFRTTLEAAAKNNELFHDGAFTVEATELLEWFNDFAQDEQQEWEGASIDQLVKENNKLR